MERETTEIVTPVDKIPVVLKTYLTGGERRAINTPYLRQAKIKVEDDGSTTKNIEYSADIDNEVQDITIQQVVVSVNGKSDNILSDILNLKDDDFTFVVKSINEITSVKKK